MRTPAKLTSQQIKTIQTIIRYVAHTSDLTVKPSEIQSTSRSPRLAPDRQLAILLVRDFTDLSIEHIAEIFNRTPSGTADAIRDARKRIQSPTQKLRYNTISEDLQQLA